MGGNKKRRGLEAKKEEVQEEEVKTEEVLQETNG